MVYFPYFQQNVKNKLQRCIHINTLSADHLKLSLCLIFVSLAKHGGDIGSVIVVIVGVVSVVQAQHF